VKYGKGPPQPLRMRRDLQRAAGVAGRHGLGAGVEEVAGLVLAEFGRCFHAKALVAPALRVTAAFRPRRSSDTPGRSALSARRKTRASPDINGG
jgi:hypothetical protein